MAWAGCRGDAPDVTHAVLVNQAMPRHPIASESVRLQLSTALHRRARSVTMSRVDGTHANPEQAWKDIGSPEYLKADQVELLLAASLVVHEPTAFRADAGVLVIDTVLEPQSVNHLRIEWESAP